MENGKAPSGCLQTSLSSTRPLIHLVSVSVPGALSFLHQFLGMQASSLSVLVHSVPRNRGPRNFQISVASLDYRLYKVEEKWA